MAVERPTGILGGAFDPPHDGHLALARRAVEHFDLGRLLVRVVRDPGHKLVMAPAEDRLVLARLAFADMPATNVALDPYSRTVDSLEALGLADAVFLVGADELASFRGWKKPERVLELARLGVATRPGVSRDRLREVIESLPHPDRVELFELEPLPISSSEIRERVASGEPISGLVLPAVEAEIGRRGLYRVSARLH